MLQFKGLLCAAFERFVVCCSLKVCCMLQFKGLLCAAFERFVVCCSLKVCCVLHFKGLLHPLNLHSVHIVRALHCWKCDTSVSCG